MNDPSRTDSGDKILAALAADRGAADAQTVAERAGLGYSTVTKKLRDLAEERLVVRGVTGDGPSLWRLANAADNPAGTTPVSPAPATDPPADHHPTDHHTGHHAAEQQPATAPPDQTAPEQTAPADAPSTPASLLDPPAPITPATSDHDSADATSPSTAARATPVPAEPVPTEPAIPNPDASPDASPTGKTSTRREPGQLRSQVVAILQDHPDTAYKVSELSNLLDGASGGAIANALTTLARQGSILQTNEHPATYRAV